MIVKKKLKLRGRMKGQVGEALLYLSSVTWSHLFLVYRELFELPQITQRLRFLCLYLGWGLDNPEFEYKEDDVGERLKRAVSPEGLFFSREKETIRLRSDSSMQSQIPSVRSFREEELLMSSVLRIRSCWRILPDWTWRWRNRIFVQFEEHFFCSQSKREN